jgi:hypothetical protein
MQSANALEMCGKDAQTEIGCLRATEGSFAEAQVRKYLAHLASQAAGC